MSEKNVVETQEVTNGEVVEMKKVEEEPKAKKPNFFKRAASKIGAGIRQVRESPVACAIGAGVGALATLGVQAWLAHRSNGPIDIPESDVTDLGETPIDMDADEIMNE